MERLQRVPLPTGPASAYGTSLPDRARHRVVPDSHPGYEGEPQAAEDCEGDRARGVHQEDRLHIAPYNSLRPRRRIWECTRVDERRRSWRHFSDGCEHGCAEGAVAAG